MANRSAYVAVLFLMVALLAVLLTGCMGTQESAVEPVEESADEPVKVEGIQRKADAAARESNLRMIDTAVQMYHSEEGVYPSNINQLVPMCFSKIPTDPAGGTYYLVKEGATVKAAVK
jgi:hypothetical protein